MTRARALRLAGKGMGTAAGMYGLRLLRPQLRGAMEGSPRCGRCLERGVGVEVVLI